MATVEKWTKGMIEKFLNKLGYIKNSEFVSVLNSNLINQSNSTTSSQVSYSTFVDHYKGWVYTTIDKIAKTIASLPFRLFVYKRRMKFLEGSVIKSCLRECRNKREQLEFLKSNEIEKEQIFDHPILNLFRNPNKLDTRFTLIYNIIIRLELAGYCGVYMPLNGLGLPGELWAVPLTRTATLEIIPDRNEIIKGYKYRDGSIMNEWTPAELIYMRYPHPGSPFQGMSPLLSQMYPYDIDLFLQQQQYALLKNKAVFGNIFSTDQHLKKHQTDDLRDLINSQFGGALLSGLPVILHSGLKIDSKSLTQSSKELMIKEVAEYARDKLITAYDVTPEKLGMVKGVNRSTIEVLDKTFIEECIQPKTMMIEEYFEKELLPRYDEALTFDFILPNTSNRDLELKERLQNLETGYTTINEERGKEDGRSPVPWGDTPWMPWNMIQINQQKPQTQPIKAKMADWDSDKKEMVLSFHLKAVDKGEQILVPLIQKHFKEQEKEVLSRLEKFGKSISGYLNGWNINKRGEWLKVHKNKVDDINIDPKKESENLITLTEPAILGIVDEAGNFRLQSLNIETPFNIKNPQVEKWLSNKLKTYSKEVEGTTFEEINAILREGFREGLPLTIIGNNLKEKFASWEKWRAQMISRTETISASNKGDLEGVVQSGLSEKLKKFWINEVDARDTHQQAGKKYNEENGILIDEEFEVGGGKGLTPGNIGLAEEDINCRCTLGYTKNG